MKAKDHISAEKDSTTCSHCLKAFKYCICEDIKPGITETSVLILQHPQEPDKKLGTARIANLCLKNSRLKVGLSWPNLKKAWGSDTTPSDWIVFYLGSTDLKKAKLKNSVKSQKPALLFVSKKNKLLEPAQNSEKLSAFLKNKKRGIILLDGTWSQAKTLWWRNAWLNKLQRCALLAPQPSLYGKLRKEPKKECLSTIETIAYCLSVTEKNSEACDALIDSFKILLARCGG